MTEIPISAIIIPATGPATVGEIPQDIRTLQGIVGGYIEAIPTMHNENGEAQAMFWCNEEGKLQGLPINRRATALWYALAGGPTGDTLCGTIILTGGNDGEGDILPAPGQLIDLWNSIHDAAAPNP